MMNTRVSGIGVIVVAIVAVLATSRGFAQQSDVAATRVSKSAEAARGKGGGAQADFDTLIDLIQSTIAPATWEEVGGEGSIVGFPGGVYVDPSGVLQRLETDVQRQLSPVWDAARLAQPSNRGRDVARDTEVRKVSLRRLERAVQRRAAAGVQPTRTMRLMAGLHRIDYLVVDSKRQDVILVGPAGDWTIGPEGRVVNRLTGRPVIRLDDLIAVLRNAFLSAGGFVCTITPTQERLAETQAYIRRTSRAPLAKDGRDQWLHGLQSSLGNQQIEITGLAAETRIARVLVEADHHMKLIGIGLEPGTDQVVSYLDRIQIGPGEIPPDFGVLRWWFTLREQVVRRNVDGNAFQLAEQMVRVLSENELLTAQGQRVLTGRSDALNRSFARSFTQHFRALAQQYPVYAELDNVFRLATLAALLKHEDLPTRMGWPLDFYLDEDQYVLPRARVPREVATVINHRVIDQKHIIATVSGGVAFQPRDLLTTGLDTTPARLEFRQWLDETGEETRWWWD